MHMDLTNKIEETRKELLCHPMYTSIHDLDDIRTFMSHHVFAVWDFMSLLKALQVKLTGLNVPWYPVGEPGIRKMINEIVLGEESDCVVGGLSHFEWYLSAMEQVGADKAAIDTLLHKVKTEDDFMSYVLSLSPTIKQFVHHTLNLAVHGEVYEIAAAFTVGRENLIPEMFTELVASLHDKHPNETSSLIHYFKRHIEVDGDDHGPMALKMLQQLCKNDPRKFHRCQEVAIQALEARKLLWDGVYAEICYNKGLNQESRAAS